MAQILVRGIPEDAMEALRARARRRGHSNEQEARMLILEAAERERAMAALVQLSDAMLARLRASGREFTDSAVLLAEDRER